MIVTMDMNAYMVNDNIGDNQRFISPFCKPCGYYILIKENKIISNISIQIYWEKLKYMSQNIDILIQNAFKPEFYGFYGVDQNLIASSDEMCQQLIVDSFVFDTNDNSIGCCLSNPEFMFGHFIDCLWSDSWNLIYSYIC